MKDIFYIIKTGERQYQLREKEGHEVISTSGDLDSLLQNLFTIVTRYRNTNTFYRKLNKITHKRPKSKEIFSIRKKEFAEAKDLYLGDIEKVVNEAEKEVEELQPLNQVKKNMDKLKAKPKEVGLAPKKKKELEVNPFNIKYGEIKLYNLL